MQTQPKLKKTYKYGSWKEIELEVYEDGSVILNNTVTGVSRHFDKEHSQEAFGLAKMNAQRYNVISRQMS